MLLLPKNDDWIVVYNFYLNVSKSLLELLALIIALLSSSFSYFISLFNDCSWFILISTSFFKFCNSFWAEVFSSTMMVLIFYVLEKSASKALLLFWSSLSSWFASIKFCYSLRLIWLSYLSASYSSWYFLFCL